MNTSINTDNAKLLMAQYTAAQEVARGGDSSINPVDVAENHGRVWNLGDVDTFELKQTAATWRDPESALRFIAETHVALGLQALGTDEGPGLMGLARAATNVDAMQSAMPGSVSSTGAEDPEFLGDLPVRLGATFPKLTMGTPSPGQVNAEAIIPAAVRADGIELSEQTKEAIAQGVHPRTFLQPGGLVTADLVAQYAKIKPGSVVHDIGGGEGGTAVHYNKALGATVSTSDVNPQFTAAAILGVQEAGANVDVTTASITALQLPPESQDAITFNQVDFYWNDGLQEAFAGLHDALKPAGRLVMSSYNLGERPEGMSDEQWSSIDERWAEAMKWGTEDARVTRAAQIVDLLEGAGFNPEKIRVIDASSLYEQVHNAVAYNQAQRGESDVWLDAHRELQKESGAIGFIVVAEK